jgi:hypothetical protein
MKTSLHAQIARKMSSLYMRTIKSGNLTGRSLFGAIAIMSMLTVFNAHHSCHPRDSLKPALPATKNLWVLLNGYISPTVL